MDDPELHQYRAPKRRRSLQPEDLLVSPLVDDAAPQDVAGVVPVPRDSVNWDEYPHDTYWPDDPVLDPSWSFWDYYNAGHGATCRGYEKLVEYHKSAYGRVQPFAYAHRMQKLYCLHVRPYMVDPEAADRTNAPRMRGPAWSARNIYEWPLDQAVPSAVLADVGRTYARVFNCMAQGQLFQSNGKVELKALDMFNKAAKHYMQLLPHLVTQRAATNAGLLGLE